MNTKPEAKPSEPQGFYSAVTWCIELERFGRKQYIGKCEATLKEIETALPFSAINGNLVTIFAV